ncbi:hypothetical protein [Rufibacter psychrotolerans]|uniref:hypothetical protein n=1 Tax=Rufibacter psychrotolerans TaxID=2812556 RepID=UPI0019681FB8|nr:hypothetical protein [Rufibacter sp. SYSU D00308]
MKKSTLIKGMSMLSVAAMVGLSSMTVSAQTKAKTPVATTQSKPKTTSSPTASATKAKPATASTAQAKPKAPVRATTQGKPKTAASTQKKATAQPVIAAAPVQAAAPVTEPAVAPAREAKAAKRQTAAAFEGGTNVIGFGFGLVDNLEYSGRRNGAKVLKPLTFSYERGLNVAAGPGTIGVGGVFSYSHIKWEEDYKYSVMYFAAKGTYHYNFTQNDKLDTYGGLTLGYARVKVDWGEDSSFGSYDASEGEVKVGVLAGARYFFTESVGAHVELESGPMSHITIGLNYKF